MMLKATATTCPLTVTQSWPSGKMSISVRMWSSRQMAFFMSG